MLNRIQEGYQEEARSFNNLSFTIEQYIPRSETNETNLKNQIDSNQFSLGQSSARTKQNR